MTPSQLPWSLRTQQTAAAFYRAGYPVEEIADAIGIAPAECRELVEAMRRAGWLLRRPRGVHEKQFEVFESEFVRRENEVLTGRMFVRRPAHGAEIRDLLLIAAVGLHRPDVSNKAGHVEPPPDDA